MSAYENYTREINCTPMIHLLKLKIVRIEYKQKYGLTLVKSSCIITRMKKLAMSE